MADKNGKVILRPLRKDDINQVVNIHKVSFLNSRSTRLGKRFLSQLYNWYLLFQSELSYVALYNDEVVGFVTGTLGWGGARKRFKFTFWQIVLGLLNNPKLLISKEMYEESLNFLKALINFNQKIQSREKSLANKATLDSIAVNPELRGHNIGQCLMSTFEQAAEKLGADYVALGVEYQNEGARYLYEKCGWELFKENKELNTASYRKYLIY
ncbi:MAG: GNAT family N-acetyltransferase [Candidatus Helarchaeota archaeon]